MAAALATLRNYLRDTVGLGLDAVGLERANAVIDQGLQSMDDFAEFDRDAMRSLCNAVRKPGGTIVDPNDATRVIPNPGHSIPSLCESRLILAAYGAGVYQIIGRDPILPDHLTRNRLKQFKLHYDMIENHQAPEPLQEISKTFGIMKFIDQFPVYLCECLGVSGVPLSYVIRENAVPPGAPGVQAHGRPWSNTYDSLSEELIDRAPHAGPSYEDDNATVYRLIQDAIKSTSHVSSISRHQRTRDGRGAFFDLQLHNMGNSKWDKVVESAEVMVNQKVWNGKNVRYPLKFHITKHREAHNDFQRAAQNITYVPPDETTRVRRLLNSIQCSDSTIISAKTTILADPAKRGDFEQASDFLLLAAPAPKQSNNQQRVSALKRKQQHDVGETGVENRYYTTSAYKQLTSEQKVELKKMRKANGGKKQKPKQRIAALEKKLEEQKQAYEQRISALTSNSGNDQSNGSNAPLPPAPEQRNPLQPPEQLNQRGST